MAAAHFPTIPVTAAQVGTFFVGQYYQVLQQQPDLVHQFYSDSSVAIRIDGNTRETATAMLVQQIHALVMSLSFTGIEIKTAHSVESWNGGVLVMVSGSLQITDSSGRRKFVQTFFLAPQENGYFVLNDVFHFIDEEMILHHPVVLLAQNHPDSGVAAPAKLPEPVSKYVVAEDVQARELLASVDAKENGQVNAHNFSEQQVLRSPEPENIKENNSGQEANGLLQTTVQAVQDQQAAAVEESVGEPQKHTYASILRVAKGQSTSAVVSQPRTIRNGHSAPDQKHGSQPTDQEPVASANLNESPQVDAIEGFAALENGGEVKSVYVKNLPSTVTESDVEEEFKRFGHIKPDGVAIRSRKDVGVCYAFVEFEDLSSVRNAIKAGSAQVGGRTVFIEERRPNSNVPYRGGRGRGRGNHQADAPRGRFVSRNLNRGNGHDGGDQNYSRRRTNGYYRPVVRQDRGFSDYEASGLEQKSSD